MSGEKPCKRPLKKRLRKHSPFVIDEVIVDNYVTDLHAAELFSNQDRDRITDLKGRPQKEEFVNTLMHKDEPVIQMFLNLTRKSDRQPYIYAEVMSEDEGAEPAQLQYETRRQDGAQTDQSLQAVVDERMDGEWAVITDKVVENFCPSVFLDGLRKTGLITQVEWKDLKEERLEREQSSKLLRTILPTRGNGSYEKFCQVVGDVDSKQLTLFSKSSYAQQEAESLHGGHSAMPFQEEGSDGASHDSKNAEPTDATSSSPEFHDTCDSECDSSRKEPGHIQESEKQTKGPGYPDLLMGRRKLVCAPGNRLQEDTTHFPPEPQDTSDHECGSSGNEPGQVYSQKRKGPPLHKPATLKCMKVDICQDKAGSVDEHGDDTIHLACQRGHTCRVIDLLIDGSSPNEVDEHGQTPLQITANGVKDIPKLCRVLLEHDSSIINALDEDGNQPLHLACKHDNRETVKVMLSYGANPNAMNKHEQTPLHTAVGGKKDCPELCEILLRHDARINAVDEHGNQSLHLACDAGLTCTVRVLLDFNADISAVNNDGQSSLHKAAASQGGCPELCQLLIGKGAKVNAMDGNGDTSLQVALQKGNVKTVELLLANGADYEVLNGAGETVLHLLCKGGVDRHELCEDLISRGVSPRQADRENNSPMHLALKNKLHKTFYLLFKQCGVSTVDDFPKMNIQNNDISDLLCFSVSCCDAELCQKLLDLGANPNAPNTSDLMPSLDFLPYDAASVHPLHIAVAKNNSELCRLLLDHRATVNVQMHMHYSTSRLHLAQPLHLAAQKGFIGVCRVLIEQDAFINAQTSTGTSPLHLAIVGNKDDIVRLLLCHGAILGNVMIGGVSALEWSATRGSRSLASLLHDSEAFPDEIVSQRESSLQIYMSSCSEETAVTVFLHVDVVGHDGAGRTSLTKALTLQKFDPHELITRKVVFDPDPKCQKGSCDWTTPVTSEHYRDMYDKNIAAIMAGKLDTPEVKDQYFRSKEEERLKRKTQGAKETGQKGSVILSKASKCARKTAATSANAEPSAAVQQYDQQAVQSPQDGRKRKAWAALPLCDVPDTTLSQSMETSQSIETMTEIRVPEKIKEQVSEFLKNKEFLDKAQREMMVTFSDYAGQPVLYNTLHLRMSKAGFYYVVFDASQPLEGKIPRKQEIVHVPLVDETNFDRLLEWMSTIYVMEADHSHHIMLFGEVQKALPVMFLVGTHADKLREQPCLLERQDGLMRKKLEGSVLAEHIIWASKDKMCFYVDNTLTDLQSGTVDDQVVLLRQKTEQVAHQVAQHHKVPVTWLKFEQEVRDVKVLVEAKKTMPVEDLLHLAKTVTGIQTKEELDELLHYLSDRAVLFYHPKALENGKEEVVLDVGWLISQLEKLITGVPPGLENDVKRSREKGIMTAALINHLLSDSSSGQQFLMSLMKHCDLLCQYKQLDDNCFDKADDLQDYVSLKRRTPMANPKSKEDVECSSYFVPCVIQEGITLKSADVEDACSTVPLILKSDNVCIPKPFFYRLLSRCATRFPRLPQMFSNAGYFCVYPDHKLEISLERYFLQMIVFTTNKEHLVPAVCFLVREYVTAEVDKVKHSGMSGLELKLGFYYSVTRDSAVGRQQDFVSLEDYPAIDMDIDLPSGVKVWYPDSGEIEPQMCSALDAIVTGNTSSQSLPLCTLMSSSLTSYLHVGSQPHECLLKVACMMDEEDNIGDDWRKLWSELLKQPLSEDAKHQTEGPTIYTLEMWAEGCHPSEATVGRLIRVLSAVYRNDAAEILLEYAKKSPIYPARTEDVLDILGPQGKEHFFEAINEGKMNIARVNLDLVGDGEAGKSSLCDSLMDEPFIEKRESTKGASVLYMVRTATGFATNWKKDEQRSESLGHLLVGGSVMADSRAKSLQAQPLLDSESSKGDISTNQELQTAFLEEASQISAAEGDEENISMPPVTVEDLQSNSPMSVREESSQVSSAEGGNKDTSTPSVTGEDMESSSSLRKESSQASGKDSQVLDFEKEFQTAKDLTVERAKEIKSLQDDPEEIQKRNELIYISVCDRGGQQHYLPIHTALIANCSEFIPKAYLLVFDLTKRLDGVATATYRAERGGEKVPITSYPQMKNKEIIGQWASAVDLAHPQSEMLSDNLQQKVRPYLGHPKLKRGPPMFIIGTHYDKIEGKKEEFVKKQEVAIRGILKRHEYTKRVVTVKDKNNIIFKVDNTRSGTGTPDDMVKSLKEQIVEMAMAYRKAIKATPLPYVVLELSLLNVSQPEGPDSAFDSDRKILNMKDVVPLAKKYCNIKDEERCETALKYLSSVGAIFYFFKVAGLKHKVFPDPQWLFDVMSTFVTILDEEDLDGCYLYDLDQLKTEGRMSRHLAEHLLERRQKLGVREKHYNTIFCLLQLVDIFCPDISPQSSERLTVDDADYFYVPCMLDISSIYEEQSEWELSGVAEAVSGSSNSAFQIPSLIFKPDNVSYFPEPLFFRLSSRTAYEFPEHPELKRNRIQVLFHGYCLKLELLYHSTRQYVIATVGPEDKEEPPCPGDVNLQCAHVRRFLYRQLDDAKQNGMSGFQYKVYFQLGKKRGINDVDEESLYPLPNCDEMPEAIVNRRTKKPLRKKDVWSSCIKYWYSSEPSECGDIVGDVVLAQVAKSVQHAWMKLAQAMKPWPFYRNELVIFDDYTDNSNLGKAHRMLQKWRDEHKNQATISNLKRSLVEAKLEHILPIVDHGSSLQTAETVNDGHQEVHAVEPSGHSLDAVHQQDGITPFHCASKAGIVHIMKLLYQKDHNMAFAKANDGRTALHFACQCRKKGISAVKFLDELKLSVDDRTKDGITPLMMASENGDPAIVDFLLHKGCKTDVVDKDGRTALMMACWYGNPGTADLLLKKGSKSDVVDKDGWTPFHYASITGIVDIMKLLYQKDHNVIFAKANDGRTALHIACQCRKKGISAVEFLDELKLSVDDCTEDGKTPLMVACQYGNPDVVDFLLNKGCNTNVVDKNGDTAFHHAVRHPYIFVNKEQEKRVVEQLMNFNVPSNIKNNEGLYPYQFLDGDLRTRVRAFWCEQRYAPLYSADGKDKKPEQLKLCVIGEERSGKTSIAIAMGVEADVEIRTAGIVVQKATNPELGGAIIVYDTAGHREFHKTHARFLGGMSTLFLLMLNCRLGQAHLSRFVRYFLAFVSSALNPEDLKHRPYMFIVGSHADTEEQKKLGRLQLRDVMKPIQEEFKHLFNFVRVTDDGHRFTLIEDPSIVDDKIVLNCTLKDSGDMTKLLRLIGEIRTRCLEMMPKIPIVCKNICDGLLTEQRKIRKFEAMKDFQCLVEKESDKLKGDGFDVLLEYLDDYGEAVHFEDKLIIDVPWLCQYVIGAVMPSSTDFHVRLRAADDGTATFHQIEDAVRRFREFKESKVDFPIELAVNVLGHLDICLEHPTKKGVYIFPCHIKQPKSSTAWVKDASKPVYIGRRVQCKSKQQIITPGSFPGIQCEAYKTMVVKEVWEGGIKVQPKKTAAKDLSQVEAVIEVTEIDLAIQSIDIIARGADHSQGDCLKFVDSINHLVMKALDKWSPGTVTERCYLSHASITEHESHLDSYSEETIRRAQESHQAVVSTEGGEEDRLIDIVAVDRNHIILLPLGVRQQLYDVLDHPDKDAKQPSWKDVGRTLGVVSKGSTSRMLEDWSQTLTATVDQLVAALKIVNATDALDVLEEATIVKQQPDISQSQSDEGGPESHSDVAEEVAEEVTLAQEVQTEVDQGSNGESLPKRGYGSSQELLTEVDHTSPVKQAEEQDVAQGVTIDYNSQVTQTQLMAVAKVARKEWLEVGLALGFKMEELDDYEEREPKNLKRRLLRLLVDWKKKEESSTVGALISACSDADVGGAVKRVIQGD